MIKIIIKISKLLFLILLWKKKIERNLIFLFLFLLFNDYYYVKYNF